MSKTILFFDGVCPTPYDIDTLKHKSLGGTEASCIRIVSSLAAKGHEIILAQRNRINYHSKDTVSYCPLEAEYADNNIDTVITLRDAGHYVKNKVKYPKAKHYLWMHDVVSGLYIEHLDNYLHDFLLKFPNERVQMICVSNWHKKQIRSAISPNVPLDIHRIYGPLAEYCTKTPTEYDPYKLIFFSSPHKGLEGTLEIFKRLRQANPLFKLYLSNPGYFKDATGLPDGVVNLGSLPHHSILMDHVRGSLCTFYPNTIFEETFGLVLAESEAVGTPVLAHPIGAAPEVLSHPKEIMDCTNIDAVVGRVLAWHNGSRPIVQGRKEFTLKEVTKEWEKLI